MIDREARDQANQLLERIIRSDGLTNYQLEDIWPSSSDEVIIAIPAMLSPYFNGSPEEPLQFNAFDVPAQEFIIRAALFLKSDLEYQWPVSQFEWLSLGFIDSVLSKVLRKPRPLSPSRQQNAAAFRSAGDFDVYPFISAEDYRRELQRVNDAKSAY